MKKPLKIPINCSHTSVWPLEKLVENPRNPNKHPEAQLVILGKIIAQSGWRSPIVVSRRSGYIVKGHGRFAAALKAGMTEAPVDEQDYESEAAEWADMIADNRLAELAEISMPDITALLQELQAGGLDMDLTGFDEDALASLMLQERQDEEKETPMPADKWEIAIECSDETEQIKFLEQFTKEGLKCRALIF